nr:hypothetical protein [Tanacetum cinerariifolium]
GILGASRGKSYCQVNIPQRSTPHSSIPLTLPSPIWAPRSSSPAPDALSPTQFKSHPLVLTAKTFEVDSSKDGLEGVIKRRPTSIVGTLKFLKPSSPIPLTLSSNFDVHQC